jgi:long-chain acyl-CoA synthetase
MTQGTAEVLKGVVSPGDIGASTRWLSEDHRSQEELLVTSGGKKIAPQPIEGRKRSPLIVGAILLGERRNSRSAAHPGFSALERRLQALGRPLGAREELVTRRRRLAVSGGRRRAEPALSQFERIGDCHSARRVHHRVRELTPTLKVKRKWSRALARSKHSKEA